MWWLVVMALAMGPFTLFGLRAAIQIMTKQELSAVVALSWIVVCLVSFGAGIGVAIRNVFV